MFCTGCGNAIKPGANFCGKCGRRADQGSIPPRPIQFDTSNMIMKGIYLALVLVVFICSFLKIIDVAGTSITYSKLATYIKQMVAFAELWGEDTSGTGIFSFGLFCLRLGTIAIVIGAILVFIKPNFSYVFNLSGAIRNIISMLIIVLGVNALSEFIGISYSSGSSIIAGNVWVFILFNIAIIIISSPALICKSKLPDVYAGKTYTHMDKAYRDKMGTWICTNCGKQNNASMTYCTCGEPRSGYTRRY